MSQNLTLASHLTQNKIKYPPRTPQDLAPSYCVELLPGSPLHLTLWPSGPRGPFTASHVCRAAACHWASVRPSVPKHFPRGSILRDGSPHAFQSPAQTSPWVSGDPRPGATLSIHPPSVFIPALSFLIIHITTSHSMNLLVFCLLCIPPIISLSMSLVVQ